MDEIDSSILQERIELLQDEIARLQAALTRQPVTVERWEPVEDGPYGDIDISSNGAVVAVKLYEDDGQDCWQGCHLFDGMRLCRLTPQPAAVAQPASHNLVVNEYQLGDSKRMGGITLRRMQQSSGPDKWAIYDGDRIVLSKEYEDGDPWEWEPLPSSRDEAYLQRCRYDSVEEALQHWQAWLRCRPAPGAKGEGQ